MGYYDEPFLSYSQVVNLKVDTLEFWNNCVFNTNKQERKYTDALHEGILLHSLLLEPEKEKDIMQIDYGLSVINKKYENAAEQFPDKFIVSPALFERARFTIQTLLDSGQLDYFKQFQCIGNEFPIYGNILGLPFKSKLDTLFKDKERYVIFDYKSSSNVKDTLSWGNKKGYGLQSTIYRYLTAQQYKIPVECVDMIFLIQDKKDPTRIVKARMPYDTYDYEMDWLKSELPIIGEKLANWNKNNDESIWNPYPKDEIMDFNS